jgi:membrane protein YdbS with pleckstrin-like domain
MKVGESFKPDKEFMKLYYSYLMIFDAVIFLAVILPAIVAAFVYRTLFEVMIVSASLILPFLFMVFFVAFWIPQYYASVSYSFTEGEIAVEKGVWWRHKSTVPYNRVTNIDIVQGPISRRFGVAKVRVQTAGYSATGGGGAVAEASIFGVKDFEEIRSFILKQVRRLRPVAVEAGVEAAAPEEPSQQMLAELKKIRKILEKQTTDRR